MAWSGNGNVDSLWIHLQDMEKSLINLMLESILKLESMTTAKVFLLLETPSTKIRKYCGTQELVDRYEKGYLSFDVDQRQKNFEVLLDPNVYLLRERQRRKRRLEEDFDQRY